MPRQSVKRNRSRNGRRQNISRRLVATQGDQPAFNGQQIAILDVPGDVRIASTNAGGTMAQTFAINASNLQSNFHGYFNTTFQEYRIRRVKFYFTAVGTTTGSSLIRFEEKNLSAPTLNEMANSNSVFKPNTNANTASTFTMTWTARDLSDLAFEVITSDPTSAALKIYSDLANLLSPISTNVWIFRPVATIEFRGLGLN
jgi:hypothetical protein